LPTSRSIRIAAPAAADLSAIAAHTRHRWGSTQTSDYLAKISASLQSLRDKPGMGRSRDDIATGLRAFPVGRHIIFFRDTEPALLVVRVLHQSMDADRRLNFD